jgi:tRNA(His) 5'-end guanylyltransferase
MHDPLGDRLKSEFEATTQLELPRKTHTIIRLDGKAFHTYTRGLPRPFDETLHADLVAATQFLCEQVTGTLFAYVQSDEVSLLVTDLAKPGTQPWYGGNVQKITSVTASILTAKFNERRNLGLGDVGEQPAFFDSRVFTIPDTDDVVDYFHWRYLDAWRNAVSSLASVHFSARELQHKSLVDRRVMLLEKGVDVKDLNPRFKAGSIVEPVTRESTVTYTDNRTGEVRTIEGVQRRSWESRPNTPLDAVHDLLTLDTKVNGFLAFGEYVYGQLAAVHTPQEPVGTVGASSETSLDATPGVATRPGPS